MKPYIIPIKTNTDDRGYFKTVLDQDDIIYVAVSYSRKGTFRGLHAQANYCAQSKYIHVLKGEIIDLVYDQEQTIQEFRLSENDGQVLYVPHTYAHGFFAKTDAMLLYGICDNYYTPSESITYSIYDLPDIQFESKDYILQNIKYISDKDKGL